MRNLLIPAVLVSCFGISAAGAAELCEAKPRDQWLSPEEIKIKVETLGFPEHVLAFEDGCYEAKIVMSDGKRLEIYMDPVTGEVVRIKA